MLAAISNSTLVTILVILAIIAVFIYIVKR